MASLRQLLQQTRGFASGSLEDQLARMRNGGDINAGDNGQALADTPAPAVLAPTTRDMITRPRTVTPSDAQVAAAQQTLRSMMARSANQPVTTNGELNTAPPAMAQPQPINPVNPLPDETPFGSSGEPFRVDRPRRTQMRDFVADDSQYLRDLQNQPRNWKDKVVEGIRALNTNFNGAGQVSPPTKRERRLLEGENRLGQDLTLDKARTQRELGQLVPVQLENGQVVMTPARSAGTLTSQQQGVKRQNAAAQAHVDRWKQMGRHEAVQDALRVYNSGGANDPDTLEAISETLRLPATLKPKFIAGKVVPQVDENFHIQLVDKETGEKRDTGVISSQAQMEAGRNRRQERSAAAAMQRTQALIAAGIGKLGDPDVTEKAASDLQDQIDEAKEAADKATADGFPSKAVEHLKRADQLQKTKTDLEEAANKARAARGMAGTTTAPKSTRTIDGAIKAFTKSMKRVPTADEIARMKAALEQ